MTADQDLVWVTDELAKVSEALQKRQHELTNQELELRRREDELAAHHCDLVRLLQEEFSRRMELAQALIQRAFDDQVSKLELTVSSFSAQMERQRVGFQVLQVPHPTPHPPHP